ncbi:hypothetical protein LUZ60_016662 [Juncus effusus]|nr:hypothetical protein LUZ60_016662 [Juncus effusus]
MAESTEFPPQSAPCINDVLTDDELCTILSKLRAQEEKDSFGLVCKRWLQIESASRRRIHCRAGPDMLRRLAGRFSGLTEIYLSQSPSRSFYPGVTDADLGVIASAFRQLRILDLANCKGISDNGMITVGHHLPSIEYLDVSNCKKLTDKGLTAISSECKNLKNLDVSGCKLITDTLLHALSQNCLQLEELSLSSCTKITDSGICALSDGPKHIKTLDLSKCTNIGDTCIVKIVNSSRESLVCLKLLDCSKIGDATIFALSENCPNLENLVIGGCREITDLSLQALANTCSESLRCLRMDWCVKITDFGLISIISKCKNLIALDIGSCDKVTDATFRELANIEFMSKLRVLRASNVSFTVNGVHIISEFCREIEYIDVRSCPNVSRFVYDTADIRFPLSCRVNFGGVLSLHDALIDMYF